MDDSDDELLANRTEEPPKKKIKTTKLATKAEIEHKRNLAIIRRVDCLHAQEFKNKLADLFWKIRLWPPFIVSTLLSPNFGYHDRLALAAFF